MMFTLLLLPLALGTRAAEGLPALAQQPPEVIDRHPITNSEVLWTFEVRDLLQRAASVSVLELDGKPAEEAAKVAWSDAIAFLSDFISKNVQPPYEGSQQSVRITPSGTLVSHGLPAQQEWIRSLLERNRSAEVFVVGETSWIEGPKGAFERMGVAAGPTPTVLTEKDRQRLIALGGADAKFQVLGSARLVVSPLSTGALSVGENLAYVKEYKLETVQPGDVVLPVPQIARAFDGVDLTARTLLLDGSNVVLDLAASSSRVRRPIATRMVALASTPPQELAIAIPEVERKSTRMRCTLAADGAIAFCLPVAGHEEREFLLVVCARALTPAELEALPKQLRETASKTAPVEPARVLPQPR